jgi:hypothetical protein
MDDTTMDDTTMDDTTMDDRTMDDRTISVQAAPIRSQRAIRNPQLATRNSQPAIDHQKIASCARSVTP